MKNRSLILSIPDPCTQSWDNMNAATGGRFCEYCCKTVTDFSVMSDQEIRAIINNSNGPLCGRFDSTQLRREMTVPAEPKRVWLPVALFASLMATVVPDSSNAQARLDDIARLPVARADQEMRSSKPACFEGRVVDAVTGEGMPQVSVLLLETAGRVGTFTDSLGRFKLKLPTDAGSPVLQISYVGYDTKMICLDTEPLMRQSTIHLQPKAICLAEMEVSADAIEKRRYYVGTVAVVGVKIRRETWWQRFKRLFTRPHREAADTDGQ